MRRTRLSTLLTLSFLLGLAFGTSFPNLIKMLLSPPGDYGDAPEGFNAGYDPPFQRVIGKFPTKYSTENSRKGYPGAHMRSPGLAVLGFGVSVERGTMDPNDPDGCYNMVNDDSYDDGLKDMVPPLMVIVTLREREQRSLLGI